MPASPNNTERKYADIRKRYNYLKNVKENGVQKFTSAYIMSVLAHEFYLETSTIENIVWSNATSSNKGGKCKKVAA